MRRTGGFLGVGVSGEGRTRRPGSPAAAPGVCTHGSRAWCAPGRTPRRTGPWNPLDSRGLPPRAFGESRCTGLSGRLTDVPRFCRRPPGGGPLGIGDRCVALGQRAVGDLRNADGRWRSADDGGSSSDA